MRHKIINIFHAFKNVLDQYKTFCKHHVRLYKTNIDINYMVITLSVKSILFNGNDLSNYISNHHNPSFLLLSNDDKNQSRLLTHNYIMVNTIMAHNGTTVIYIYQNVNCVYFSLLTQKYHNELPC